MSKKIVDILSQDIGKDEDESTGVFLVREELTDGSFVLQIEVTKPISIICTSEEEAWNVFNTLNMKWWIERL